jgi:integrase
MPRRNRNPPHCVLKRLQWWAKLAVPAPVRADFDGKAWLMTSLHETDRDRAYIKSVPIIREWKTRITAARAHQIDPLQATIARLAKEFATLRKAPLNPAGVKLVKDVVAFVFQAVGGIAAIEQYTLLSSMRGDVEAALATVPNSRQATAALRQITTGEGPATPYTKYIDRWVESQRASKTRAQYESAVREFAATVTVPIQRLTGPVVQGWIESSLKLRPAKTLRFKVGANRAYWIWLGANGLADGEHNPFRGRLIKEQQTAVEKAETARARFALNDVPLLWQEAARYGDHELAGAVQLSAYMGWRREEVVRLRIENLRVDRETGVFCIRGGLKSEAGVRDLPIPPGCEALVRRLAQRTDSDGYLLRCTSLDKWGHRSNGIGMRFTRLKRRLGYDGTRVYHSIRHSFAFALAKARAPLHSIGDLLGHAGTSVTEGYLGECDLGERLHWLSLVDYPLDGEASRQAA